MPPLPYAEVIPAAVLCISTVTFLMGEAAIAVRSRQRAGQSGSDGADVRTKILTITLIAILGIGAFSVAALLPAAAVASSETSRRIVFTIGALLAAAGIVVRQWSIRELGHFFTLDVRVVDDQEVVDTGALATYLGFGLMLGNYVSIIMLMLPTPLYVKRIFVEERHLRDEIGDPYSRYLRGRKRLIPGIW